MRRTDIKALAAVRAPIAVSLLLDLDTARPGNERDPLRVRQLVEDAVREIESSHDRRTAQPIVDRLREAVESVDIRRPSPGLAIFVTADDARVLRVSAPVRERVVVADRFAVRDLLQAAQSAPTVRVLVLSQRQTRLFEGNGLGLVEVTDGRFPVSVEYPREEDTPHRDLPIRESVDVEAFRFAFRATDRALAEVDAREPLPLVLVGTKRDIAIFERVTAHGERIVERVEGSHNSSSPAQLAELVAPAIERWCACRREAAARTLLEAVGTPKAAVGLDRVWDAACAGRGHLFVTESDLEIPARFDGDRPVPDAAGTSDAIDLIVGEIVGHAGDVTFVDAGALEDCGGFGLLLRY